MTPDLMGTLAPQPLPTRAQLRSLRSLRTRHDVTRTYHERWAPHRVFAYTGEYNGVEIAIYQDGLVLGEPPTDDDWMWLS